MGRGGGGLLVGWFQGGGFYDWFMVRWSLGPCVGGVVGWWGGGVPSSQPTLQTIVWGVGWFWGGGGGSLVCWLVSKGGGGGVQRLVDGALVRQSVGWWGGVLGLVYGALVCWSVG